MTVFRETHFYTSQLWKQRKLNLIESCIGVLVWLRTNRTITLDFNHREVVSKQEVLLLVAFMDSTVTFILFLRHHIASFGIQENTMWPKDILFTDDSWIYLNSTDSRCKVYHRVRSSTRRTRTLVFCNADNSIYVAFRCSVERLLYKLSMEISPANAIETKTKKGKAPCFTLS